MLYFLLAGSVVFLCQIVHQIADLRQGQRERVKIHCWLGRKQAAEHGAKSPLFPFSHFSDRLLFLPPPQKVLKKMVTSKGGFLSVAPGPK